MKPDDFTRMTLTVHDGVGVITLNRPERRNAWAGSSAVEYRWALHLCEQDPAVKVVVLTGEVDFCVGADSGLLDDIGSSGGDMRSRGSSCRLIRRTHLWSCATITCIR